MQATPTRLHPLLTVAAVSVTVLSAVGVAALTGMIPTSSSTPTQAQLAERAEPAAPAPAAAQDAPRPKAPVKKRPAPRAPQEPIYREAGQAPIAQAPGVLAVVESVREVRDPGEAKGVGAIAGGVTGLILGKKLGKDKDLVTILGAAGGAIAGHQIERQARATQRWETAVRLDDGSQRTISSEVQPAWRAGDRVRLVDDKLLPV